MRIEIKNNEEDDKADGDGEEYAKHEKQKKREMKDLEGRERKRPLVKLKLEENIYMRIQKPWIIIGSNQMTNIVRDNSLEP